MKVKKCILLIVLCYCVLFNNSFAASGSQYLFTGGFPAANVQSLKYVLSGGDTSYQSLMSSGANMWNSISSKVSVSLNSEGAKVSIYKSTTTTQGLMGQMFPYYRNRFGSLVQDTNCTNIWECADVFGYENQMSSYGYNDTNRKSVYCHEMGHALSLAHNDSTTYLIMNSDATNVKIAVLPHSDDKSNLKLKWGN